SLVISGLTVVFKGTLFRKSTELLLKLVPVTLIVKLVDVGTPAGLNVLMTGDASDSTTRMTAALESGPAGDLTCTVTSPDLTKSDRGSLATIVFTFRTSPGLSCVPFKTSDEPEGKLAPRIASGTSRNWPRLTVEGLSDSIAGSVADAAASPEPPAASGWERSNWTTTTWSPAFVRFTTASVCDLGLMLMRIASPLNCMSATFSPVSALNANRKPDAELIKATAGSFANTTLLGRAISI